MQWTALSLISSKMDKTKSIKLFSIKNKRKKLEENECLRKLEGVSYFKMLRGVDQ